MRLTEDANITEVPSLLKGFCDTREEHCVSNLFKSCGSVIKTLSFPDHAPPLSILRYCYNVVGLSLPATNQETLCTRYNACSSMEFEFGAIVND